MFQKNKKRRKLGRKRKEYGENKEVGNIEEKVFVIFVLFLKQSKNVRKLIATNC